MRQVWSPTSSVEGISLQRTTTLHTHTAMSHAQEMAVHLLVLTLGHTKQCKSIIIFIVGYGYTTMHTYSQRRWSDPNSWPSRELPREGEEVTISSRWRMLVDVSPPPLSRVIVLGELRFEDERDYNFTANLVRIHKAVWAIYSCRHYIVNSVIVSYDIIHRYWSMVPWLVWSLEQRAAPSPTVLSSHWLVEGRILHWYWPAQSM